MNKESVIKIGKPIRVWRDKSGNPMVSYYLVGLGLATCGVAVFYVEDDFCTAAIVKDASGSDIVIEDHDNDRFTNWQELKELYEIYSWAFS